MVNAQISTATVVRFTDFVAKFSPLPSDESLGYCQQSANADKDQVRSSMRAPEIKIVPVGTVDQNLLDYLALTIPGSFDASCNTSTVTVDTQDAYHPSRRQYHSTQLLARLLELNLAEGTKLLGVTEVDLFIPILTFVFGEAQLGGRVALISAHRLHQQFYGLPEDKKLFYSRCEKEANHELGHTRGLTHCHSYDCVMHVSNSVEQVDLKRSSFCVTCDALMRQANGC
jgi:archaemetzincin